MVKPVFLRGHSGWKKKWSYSPRDKESSKSSVQSPKKVGVMKTGVFKKKY